MKATTEIRERERERGNMGDAGNRNRKSSVAGEAEAEAESRQVTGDMDMDNGAWSLEALSLTVYSQTPHTHAPTPHTHNPLSLLPTLPPSKQWPHWRCELGGWRHRQATSLAC